jgi:hypothetical protein
MKGTSVMGERNRMTGGCLCGALRYEAQGVPSAMGLCYCSDCRKASGSGFIPFAVFPSESLHITGPIIAYTSKAANGTDAVRNSCAVCASLVFGGPLGKTDSHTIYVGSADDPTWFKPTVAIFARNLPPWVVIPPQLRRYDALPQ